MLKINSAGLENSGIPRIIERLAAAGLSRLLSHMQSGSFAILSASRGQYSPQENKGRTKSLQEFLHEHHLGFVQTAGVWPDDRETNPQLRKMLREDSLFIPGVSKNLAQELAAKYDQESYIWGENGTYAIIQTATGDVYQSGNVIDDLKIIEPEELQPSTNVRNKRFTWMPEQRAASSGHNVIGNKKWLFSKGEVDTTKRCYFYSIEGDPKYIGPFGICNAEHLPNVRVLEACIPLDER